MRQLMNGRHAFEWKRKIVYVVVIGPGKLMVLASGSWGQWHFRRESGV